MPLTEIVRDLQGIAASLALRLPISWVNLLTGPAVSVDGRLLDVRTQWYLQLVARSGRPPLEQQSVEEARREFDAFMPVLSGAESPIGGILDRTIAGPGGALRVRLYSPTDTIARLVPAILYFHGGGWTIGSLEAYDRICRFYCARTGCAVVAVDYRLAPEHKYPAAVDDALAAWRWLAAEAAGLGVDSARIVVAGDSAGGTLAAVLAQALRDPAVRDGAPSPCLQWLLYPATDLAMDTPSWTSCGEGYLLTRAAATWFRGHYLNDLREIEDPRASPLRAADLSGAAPALIYTAGFDPLRDEGRAYADRLTAAGVKTIHREFDSLIHGFAGLRGPIQAAARAMDEMVAGVRHELTQLGR